MAEIIKSYIGVGKVLARVFGTTGKFRHVGNVSGLPLKHTVDVQRQPDFTRSGGGTAVRVERIQQIECAMTWLTFSPENWAIAMAGVASTVALDTIADEVIKGYKGATVPLAHPPSVITTVTDSAGITTYTEGTDYEMSGAGLYFPDASTIVEAADLKVDYDHGAYTRLEAAMGTATELELMFEGLNEADSDKAVIVNLWRVSVPSAEEIQLIGTTLGEMKFAAELLKDASKGTGVSAYYRALLGS